MRAVKREGSVIPWLKPRVLLAPVCKTSNVRIRCCTRGSASVLPG